jgi:hypothetical protein
MKIDCLSPKGTVAGVAELNIPMAALVACTQVAEFDWNIHFGISTDTGNYHTYNNVAV